MNTKYSAIILLSALASTASLSAQSSIDLATMSQSQLRGTARYMSMAGAFGALGGDLSTLTQNPAGIGVYRSSDISITLDIDPQRNTLGSNATDKQTNFACNSFGYVGAANLGNSIMPYFQWGASYNRVNSFNRRYGGLFKDISTSWSNYVADFSQGYAPDQLLQTDDYNPFFASDGPDWLSALAYNNWLINDNPFYGEDGDYNDYAGLFMKNYSNGSASVDVEERGYIDEYSINFGGNFANMVYWGIGFGIRDLSFTRHATYGETIENALVPQDPTYQIEGQPTQMADGTADWDLTTYQRVSGSGFNLKVGLIFKPINEFRLGLAVHTPTWYNLNYEQSAYIDGDFIQYQFDDDTYRPQGYTPRMETGSAYWSRAMKTPWRLMVSAAGVIGGRFIISADYVYENWQSMAINDDNYADRQDIANDVKQYYQPSNELRLGVEARVTPNFSVRAGYGYTSASSKSEARNGQDYVYTSGVSSMYAFEGERHNLTLGLGFRTGRFYVDAAYVHSRQTSEWNAYSPFPRQEKMAYELAGNAERGPKASLRDIHNRIALTVGFKF